MTRYIIIRRIIIVWMLLLPLSLKAQYRYQPDFQQKFDNLTWKDGLPAEKVLTILQDKAGLMWFGTTDGLVRYDGHNLRIYRHKNDDTTTLSGNYITSLVCDNSGNIWIGTKSGLNCYNYKSGKFRRFVAESYNPNALRANYVRALAAADSLLWIETVDGTLTRMHIATEKMRHYKHEAITQPYYDYHTIFVADSGLWIGGRNMGPVFFNPTNENFTYIEANPKDSTKKRDNDVACFYKDHKGQFWISATDGVYRFQPEKRSFSKFLGTSTFSITEDETGNVWFATGNGAYAFNRKNRLLKHYPASENHPEGLTGSHINKVFADHTGTVWLATNNGISRLPMHKYKFRHISHIPGNPQTLSGNHASALLTDQKGRLWVGTMGYGLDVFSPELVKIAHFETNPNNPNGLASNKINALYQDKAGMLWIGLWSGIGFNRYNQKTNQFTLYSFTPESYKNDWYNDFLEDSKGRFWLGFWGAQGAMLFNRDKEKFTGKHFFNWSRPLFRRINKVTADKSGNVWLIAKDRILYQYNAHQKTFRKVNAPKEPLNEINRTILARYKHLDIAGIEKFTRILDIATDNRQNLWIADEKQIGYIPLSGKSISQVTPPPEATIRELLIADETLYCLTSSGLWRYNRERKSFDENVYAQTPIKCIGKGHGAVWLATGRGFLRLKGKTLLPLSTNRFADKQIKALREYNRALWIGTDKGLYQYFWRSDSIVAHVRKSADCRGCISDNFIHALHIGPQSQLWAATDKGLNRYQTENGHFRQFLQSGAADGLYNDRIFSMCSYRNTLFLASDKGLQAFHTQSGIFSHFNKPGPKALTSRLTTCFYEDSYGDIWIGTSDNGLNRLLEGKRQIRHYSGKYPKNRGFTAVAVNALHETSEGKLWVATNKGLYLFLRQRNQFRHYTQNGLPDEPLKAINSGNKEGVWLAYAKHLVHFIPGDTAIVYNRSDGLQPGTFVSATTRLQDGRLVFGGEKGLTLVDSKKIRPNPHVPQIRITGFLKMREPLAGFSPQQKTVTLNYRENFFTIHFSALDYNAPEDNQYRYRLQGVDHNWIRQEGQSQAAYTDVAPGSYRFEVYASNNDGVWNSAPAVLKVHITPPFWQTLWFYLLLGGIIAATATFLIYLRIAKLKSDKRGLQLEQQLLMSQMNPHFIFNSLTSIQNFVMQNETLKASHYLARFARLIRFILNHSRERLVTVEQEMQMLQHFLALQKMRFSDKFNFSIETAPELDTELMLIPPMLIQPFVENAVKHAFPQDFENGMITIYFYMKNNKLKVVIRDNGIGIAHKQAQQTPLPEHQSLGMRITKERIKNLNKLFKQPVKISITDLHKKDPAQNGT